MDTIERVTELTRARNLSLYQLARISDVPYVTLRNAKARHNQLSVDTIERICMGLGITMSEFFSDELYAS